MLKMYINNEEVLSNKEISIKEDILNPSSTILNNVYPKTWEATKDYITNFYYPLDYSKFKLENYTHIAPIQGSYATITNSGQISGVDITKEQCVTSLKGNTTQYTTTQSANLFDKSILIGGWVRKSNGTALSQYTDTYNYTPFLQVEPNTTYTLDLYSATGLGSAGVCEYSSSDESSFIKATTEDTRIINFTTTATTQYIRFTVRVDSKDSVMWVKGSTLPSEYVPFVPNSPSPDYPQPINVVTGLQEVEVCGKNYFNKNNPNVLNAYFTTSAPTITSNTNARTIFIKCKPNTTYVCRRIKGNIFLTGYTTEYPTIGTQVNEVVSSSTNIDTNYYYEKITTGANAQYLVVRLTSVASGSDIVSLQDIYDSLQIEENTTPTTYTSYIGNSYEVNLGKNLLDLSHITTAGNNGLTATNNNGELSISGTSTNTSFISLYQDTLNLKAGTYTLSTFNPVASTDSGMDLRITPTGGSGITARVYLNVQNNSATFTLNEDLVKGRLIIRTSSGVTLNNFIIKPQLEKGSQATSYSPYFTPIELCKIGNYQDKIFRNENLFNYRIPPVDTLNGTLTDNGVRVTSDSNWEDGWYAWDIPYEFEVGSKYYVGCKISNMDEGNIVTVVRIFDNPWTQDLVNEEVHTNGYVNAEFTANSSVLQMELYVQGMDRTQYADITEIYISKVNEYTPYGEKGNWYLHKEIGKVVLNGSETGWSYDSTNSVFINNSNLFSSQYLVQNGLSNYFTNVVNSNITNNYYAGQNLQNGQFSFRVGTKDRIYLKYTTYTSADNFKTWLSTHNTIVYYVLANPTTTEITNSELINQLNEIELIEGLNNITITSSNLPGILELHYNYVVEKDIHDLIFSGMVKNTGNISLNPRQAKYCSLEVLDYKTLLSEGDTLDFVISNKTILEAINMVISAISKYGFELGNVNILNGNDIIGVYSTDNKTAYDVLQYLADISGAKWNCRVKDDKSMYIDFYDPNLLPRGKQIEYTTEWACQNSLVDLSFNYGTRDYRNKQVIISNEVYADIDTTEEKYADSYTTDFILDNNIASIKEIKVNGIEKTVATTTDKDIGVYADFYYKPGTNIVSSNSSNQPYTFGNTIEITYTPIIKGREVVQNDDEITRLGNQLEVNGTIARYESRNDETDTNKLLAIGETYLKYKGEAEVTLSLTTKDNDLYQVGQMVYFNAPIQELAKEYLVKSKEINIISVDDGTKYIFYVYELSSSFNSEKAVNWFDNQRNKLQGNIKEGDYISRNIDISSIANVIWFGLQVSEITAPTGNNELNATLDSPINE